MLIIVSSIDYHGPCPSVLNWTSRVWSSCCYCNWDPNLHLCWSVCRWELVML